MTPSLTTAQPPFKSLSSKSVSRRHVADVVAGGPATVAGGGLSALVDGGAAMVLGTAMVLAGVIVLATAMVLGAALVPAGALLPQLAMANAIPAVPSTCCNERRWRPLAIDWRSDVTKSNGFIGSLRCGAVKGCWIPCWRWSCSRLFVIVLAVILVS